MFDWKESSIEQCAKHVAEVSAQNTTSVITYYRKIGDTGMLTKIQEARKLAKKLRIIVNAERIKCELLQENLQNADNTSGSSASVDE